MDFKEVMCPRVRSLKTEFGKRLKQLVNNAQNVIYKTLTFFNCKEFSPSPCISGAQTILALVDSFWRGGDGGLGGAVSRALVLDSVTFFTVIF